MNKTLILFFDKNLYYFNNINNEEVQIESIFKKYGCVLNFILKLLKKINSKFTRLFYGSWYKKLDEYQKIIVLDTTLKFDINLLYNIQKKATTKELYLYSWNIVTDTRWFEKTYQLAVKSKFKYYSYDEGDCEKYKLNFNTIMYDANLTMEKDVIEYDTFFLGFLKDRKNDIQILYKALINANLKPKFIIVNRNNDNDSIDVNKYPFDFRDTYMNYFDYLKFVNKSTAILDIAQQGQLGYSMRVMESIFLDKKLITTNKHVKNSIFYNENNILIIDFNDISSKEIIDFLKKEFIPYNKKVKKYYSIEAWIKRFK